MYLLNMCHMLPCHRALVSNAFTQTAGLLFYQEAKHLYVGGGKRYMNYKKIVSLRCGFAAVRIRAMFAACYCRTQSGSIA